MSKLPQIYELTLYDHGVKIDSKDKLIDIDTNIPREIQFMEIAYDNPFVTDYSIRQQRPAETKVLIKGIKRLLIRQKRQQSLVEATEYLIPSLEIGKITGYLALMQEFKTPETAVDG